jgi:multidrug resistance efflux pump
VIGRRTLRSLAPVVILLAGASGAFALLKSKPLPPPIESREKAWIVEVETVSPGPATPTLALYGRVESPRLARLSAAITADVRSVEVLEGQTARGGDVLLRLDDREAGLLLEQRRAEVADIEAQLNSEDQRHRNDVDALGHERTLFALATKEVQRLRELADRQVGSRSQLDLARQAAERIALDVKSRELAIREHASRKARLQAQLERARALRDLAALELERTEIRAPYDGRVAAVDVAPGDRVRAGDRLLSLYDTEAIEIRSQIPARHLPRLRGALQSGQKLVANAVVDGVAIRAELDRLTGEVARRSGGADAFLKVTQGAGWLPLGRTVALMLDLPLEQGVVVLPFEAVYGTTRIFVLDNDRMRAVAVERIGEVRTTDGESRVLLRAPALREVEQVIVTQLPNAIDGLRVRLATPAGRAGAAAAAQRSSES